jgi:hypothetical protein
VKIPCQRGLHVLQLTRKQKNEQKENTGMTRIRTREQKLLVNLAHSF